jgi:hypothetical protein
VAGAAAVGARGDTPYVLRMGVGRTQLVVSCVHLLC